MSKWLCFFALLFWGKLVSAQNSATATATVKIVVASGNEEGILDSWKGPVGVSALFPPRDGATTPGSIPGVDFTPIKIVGDSYVHALGTAPATLKPKGKLLSSALTVKPTIETSVPRPSDNPVDNVDVPREPNDDRLMPAMTVYFN